MVGKPAEALEQGKEELCGGLPDLDVTLAQALPDDTGVVRLNEEDSW
ncbi:hypothetical protein [Nonomuraea sp. NPDC049784]